MKKKLDMSLVSIVTVLGVIHTACTPIFYKSFSLDALWFAGTGLSFVFLGLIHMIRLSTGARIASILAFGCSALITIFSTLIVVLLSAPQAFVALVVNFLLLIVSGLALRSK